MGQKSSEALQIQQINNRRTQGNWACSPLAQRLVSQKTESNQTTTLIQQLTSEMQESLTDCWTEGREQPQPYCCSTDASARRDASVSEHGGGLVPVPRVRSTQTLLRGCWGFLMSPHRSLTAVATPTRIPEIPDTSFAHPSLNCPAYTTRPAPHQPASRECKPLKPVLLGQHLPDHSVP